MVSAHSSSKTLLSTLHDLVDHSDTLDELGEKIQIVAEGRSA